MLIVFTKDYFVNLKQKFILKLAISQSKITEAGQGVFLKRGKIRQGQLVALYPGTVFSSSQPIL